MIIYSFISVVSRKTMLLLPQKLLKLLIWNCISVIMQKNYLKGNLLMVARIIFLLPRKPVLLNILLLFFSVNIVIIQPLDLFTWKLIYVNILVICFSVSIVIIQLLILVAWKPILLVNIEFYNHSNYAVSTQFFSVCFLNIQQLYIYYSHIFEKLSSEGI